MSSLSKESSQPLPEHGKTDSVGWQSQERLSKRDAEMLLDWLEAHGFSQRDVIYDESTGFTVRWRR